MPTLQSQLHLDCQTYTPAVWQAAPEMVADDLLILLFPFLGNLLRVCEMKQTAMNWGQLLANSWKELKPSVQPPVKNTILPITWVSKVDLSESSLDRTATFWNLVSENPFQMYSYSWTTEPGSNKGCCFKPLSVKVICYGAIDNE